VELDGRIVSGGYRFGYQGSEKDNETKGNGNSYTTEFRQYDPRLGRWLSLDPMMLKYPYMSPYCGYNNNPIYFKDPSGAEGEEGNQSVQKHKIKQDDNLSTLAKKYKTSVANLAKWNNIKDVNTIYAGQDLIVSDPSRVGARDKFETNPEVGTATGRIIRNENESTTTASNGVELGIASIMNYSIVYFVEAIQKKIESDPAMKSTQSDISSSVKSDSRYGKENFFLMGTKVVEFGGKRWSAKDEAWGGFNSKNPILHKKTWEVAVNELTWALRHATVHYWVEVKADGSFNIEYRLFDTLDLSGSKSRSEAYNLISETLGYVYHNVSGGNKSLQTRATWSVNLK
jgi:RHS repeat-associated protein